MLTLLLFAACTPPQTSAGDDTAQSIDSADADTDTDSDSDTDTGAIADPWALAAEVDGATLHSDIKTLQDFGTRYTGTAGNEAARAWIVEQLEATGMPTEEDTFSAGTNVIARLQGTDDPEVIWVFSAHYDSTSEMPDTFAPGADDNASGVAAMLSAARILSQHEFHGSIWFVAMGAEEQGSLGSAHLADRMLDEGLTVRGVVAPDMIAYWPLGDGDAFDILGDTESSWMVDDLADAADHLGVANKKWIQHRYCQGDDHTSFQDAGIPAISPMDCVEAHNLPASGEDTPWYHTSSDTIETLSLPFTGRVTQVIVGALAIWADPA